MTSARHRLSGLLDPLTALYLVTVLVSLIRAPDLPSTTVHAGSTSVSINPSDVLLVALGVWVIARVVRRRDLPRASLHVLVPLLVFAGWILVTAALNGSEAFVAAGKFVELAVLAVATVTVITRGDRIWPLVVALLGMNAAADISALHGFVHNFNARQPSFLGEHDLAALSTMTLSIWFAHLYYGTGRHRRWAQACGVVGAVGITLGAALASLIGVYLAVIALALVARRRREFDTRRLALTIVILVVISAAVLNLRADNLGFLRAWFGTHETNAASQPEPGAWSQRLIFAYVGGRVFLSHPLTGTGWYPELPAKEYRRFLPDARHRFPDQPAHYFPPADGRFIPQMAYDQILYELGVLGALVFLVLGASTVRESARAGLAWPSSDPEPLGAYVAPSWTASMVGVLAGIGLFGGATVTVLFWLTIGMAAALGARVTAEA
jgi:O-Antigen ligase